MTGFTSFISHSGGPPASMYLLGLGLDKTTYQASTVLVFWWVNLIKVPAYIEVRMLNRSSSPRSSSSRRSRSAGSLPGSGRTGGCRTAVFFRLTYGLLAVAGAKLVCDALV